MICCVCDPQPGSLKATSRFWQLTQRRRNINEKVYKSDWCSWVTRLSSLIRERYLTMWNNSGAALFSGNTHRHHREGSSLWRYCTIALREHLLVALCCQRHPWQFWSQLLLRSVRSPLVSWHPQRWCLWYQNTSGPCSSPEGTRQTQGHVILHVTVLGYGAAQQKYMRGRFWWDSGCLLKFKSNNYLFRTQSLIIEEH